MALYDSDALTLETNDAAPSLPDPTTVNGRTHILANTSTAAAVWSSVGATPFVVGGVNAATLTVPAGQAVRVQSNGTRWVSTGGPARPIFAATAVTDAGGLATFAFPAGLFSAAPVAVAQTQAGASASPLDYRITAISATSCTVAVRSSPATVIALLGLTLLGASVPAAGVTIHLHATPAGVTP